MPTNRPKFFVYQLISIDFHFELGAEEIETVYLVKGDSYHFSMIISDAREWVIKGEVAQRIQDLEDHLGEAINSSDSIS